MKRFVRGAFAFAFVPIVAILAACGGGGGGGGSIPSGPGGSQPTPSSTATPTPIPTPTGALQSTTATITAAGGGTASLSDGSSLTIAPNVVAQNETIQLSSFATPIAPPTNSDFAPVGHDVYATLSTATTQARTQRRAAGTSNAPLTITIPTPAAGIDDSTLADVHVTYSDGSQMEFGALPQLTNSGVQVSIPHLSSTPTTIEATLAKFALTSGQGSPGLRYYNRATGTWSRSGSVNQAALHTLFLLHGIFSSVEDSFQPAVVNRMMDDGGYDQVIGYDYPWLQTLDQLGPSVGDTLANLGVYGAVDVLAHSYGTLVAISAMNRVESDYESGSLNVFPPQIQNLMLIEGPLNGALIAEPNFFASFLLSDKDLKTNISQSQAYALSQWSDKLIPAWVQQFTPGAEAAMEAQLQNYVFGPNRVILAGGTSTYPSQQQVYFALTGQQVPELSDGVIGYSSATCTSCAYGHTPSDLLGGPPTATIYFSLPKTHTGLLSPTDLSGIDAIMMQDKFVDENIQSYDAPTSNLNFNVVMKGVGSSAGAEDYEQGGPLTVTLSASPTSGYIAEQITNPPILSPFSLVGFQVTKSPSAAVLPPPSTIVTNVPTDMATLQNTWADPTSPSGYTSSYEYIHFYVYPDCANGCPAGFSPQFFAHTPQFRVLRPNFRHGAIHRRR